jgi:transcription initiation factor TFIID subunit 5
MLDIDGILCDSAPCSTFSPDMSLMAAGFAESYIRIWSLKGDKLKGLRSDFQASSIRDCEPIHQFY